MQTSRRIRFASCPTASVVTLSSAFLFCTVALLIGAPAPAQSIMVPPRKPSPAISIPSQEPEPGTLPVAPVSSLPSIGTTDVSAQVPAQNRPDRTTQHLDVEYDDNKVSIEATNASLDQVLHEVAKKTNTRITGGVSDERVFGRYGPASPAALFALLLDGTGTNMLLVDDPSGASELILTARRGGITPPSSSPPARDQQASDDQDETPNPQYAAPARPFLPPAGNGRGPVAATADGAPDSSPAAQLPTDSTDSVPSANGGRTPQQIYDQLQKLMQQKQAPVAPQ